MHWITVPCNENHNLSGFVVCEKSSFFSKPYSCNNPTSIYVHGKCHEMLAKQSHHQCQEQKLLQPKPKFSEAGKGAFYQEQSNLDAKVYNRSICINRSEVQNFFQCNSKEYISIKFVCDRKLDCQDKSDEQNCTCNHLNALGQERIPHCSSNIQQRCGCGELCFSLHQKCSAFDKHVKVVFQKTTKQKNTPNVGISGSRSFICRNATEIDTDRVNDLVSDCISSEDEPELITLAQGHKSNKTCAGKNIMPCFPGHSKCFYTKQMCQYRINANKVLEFCRNGGHLAECKNFDCQILFKCFRSYCIQNQYVCDGKLDCAGGIDEIKCPQLCIFSFKCRSASFCLNFGFVCDGSTECPHGDDELLCDFPQCYSGCLCLGLAIRCENISPLSFGEFLSVVIISLSDVSSTQVSVSNCLFLKITNNRFTKPTSMRLFHVVHLLLFKFEENNLDHISSLHLKSLSLITFSLAKNVMTSIAHCSFTNVPAIKALDISHNRIFFIDKLAFLGLNYLASLSVVRNNIHQIDPGAFYLAGSSPTVLIDQARFCCLMPENIHCYHRQSEKVVCRKIFRSTGLKIAWISCILFVFIINSASLKTLRQIQNIKSRTSFECLMEFNFSLSILLILYMIIIWAADTFYTTGITGMEIFWTRSFWCSLGFFLLACHLQCSMFASVVLALSRTFVTKNPFNSIFKRRVFIRRLICTNIIITSVVTTMVLLSLNKQDPDSKKQQVLCIAASNTKSFQIYYIAAGTLEFVTPVALSFLYVILVKEFKRSSTERSSGGDVMSYVVFGIVFEMLTNVISRTFIGAGCILTVVASSELQTTGTLVLLFSTCSQKIIEPLHFVIKRMCTNYTWKHKQGKRTCDGSGTGASN